MAVAWYLEFSVVHDLWHLLISAFQLLCRQFIKSFIQGFLPSIALKIFLIVLPTILMFMSKFEGLILQSSLQRRFTSKYYIFLFFNVFLGSVITGSALEQLKATSICQQMSMSYAITFTKYLYLQDI
jgi:hypothetical protein